MVAVAKNLVADVGEVDREVVGVGAVAGVGLEEFVPDEDAVFVAELVEILAGGLADPVADHVHVGEGVHVNLGIEAGARNALEGFVEAPVAAADEDLNAVDRDGEGVHAAVGDFADAEGGVVGVGVAAVFDEVEMEGGEVLRAVAVGPPQFWIRDVEDGRGFGIEGDGSSLVGLEGDLLRERDVSDVAFEGAGLWFGGGVLERGVDGDVGGVGFGKREVGDDLGIVDEDGTGGGEPDFLPEAGVAIADSVEPVPAEGAEEGGAVDGGDAAIFADAVGDGVLVGFAGMRLRGDFDGKDGGRRRA